MGNGVCDVDCRPPMLVTAAVNEARWWCKCWWLVVVVVEEVVPGPFILSTYLKFTDQEICYPHRTCKGAYRAPTQVAGRSDMRIDSKPGDHQGRGLHTHGESVLGQPSHRQRFELWKSGAVLE
jgi:hypothetical protein